MVKSLLCWPPGCSSGPDWRNNILSRRRYCGGVDPKCVHESLTCCCGGGEGLCCCKYLTEFGIGDVMEIELVESGEILEAVGQNNCSAKFPDTCFCVGQTLFTLPTTGPNCNYSGGSISVTMSCPAPTIGEHCGDLHANVNAGPVECDWSPGPTEWLRTNDCFCGDTDDPFYAKFGPWSFGSIPGPPPVCECDPINFIFRERRTLLMGSPASLSPARRAAEFKPLRQQRTPIVPEDGDGEPLPEDVVEWLNKDAEEDTPDKE